MRGADVRKGNRAGAARARARIARLRRAGLGWAGRKAGRTRGFAGGRGGWQPGRVDWVRRVAPPSPRQALSSHAGLGKRRGIHTGRSSRRLRSRPGRCPSSASSGLQRNPHFSTSGGWSSVVLQRQPSVNPMSFEPVFASMGKLRSNVVHA
ncbi:hypothetical protein ABFV05_017488 [Capra hircus]